MPRVVYTIPVDGPSRAIKLRTGERHTIILNKLVLDHRYHDDDPIQNAAYTVEFSDGSVLEGKLDEQGRAVIYGVPDGVAQVRFGPDQREYTPVSRPENPRYRAELSDADYDAWIAKYM